MPILSLDNNVKLALTAQLFCEHFRNILLLVYLIILYFILYPSEVVI